MKTQVSKPHFPVRRDNFTAVPSRKKGTYPWWQTMCLSGVDYFSTLGYQPGIALLAAGALAPLATLILVAVTLLGAVPVYRAVAAKSPHGLGSVALVENIVHGWKAKFLILVLLGFALTDFMVTITLSSSDASAHLLHSTSSPWLIPLTVGLIVVLAAVFMRGFTEAVSVAVVIVGVYLSLTTVVIAVAMYHVVTDGAVVSAWWASLWHSQGNPWMVLLVAVIVFPKLALGLSGFETGVSVMPLIRADNLEQRIHRGKLLVTVSAAIMSVFLISSAFVCALLIPETQYSPGGAADGRALAYLAQLYLGDAFGVVYAIASVAILWFAGASAMAGMLALIPRYLPRYGMAPEWARRSRPMVLLLSALAIVIVLIFRADVDAQSGAYATGVLVLLVSGAVSVAVLSDRKLLPVLTALVLGVTLLANVVERPDGLKVAAFFIAAIVAVSLFSRWRRGYELRDVGVTFNPSAERILQAHSTGSSLTIIPSAPGGGDAKVRGMRMRGRVRGPVVLLEVTLVDPSSYAEELCVRGGNDDGVPVLRVAAPSVANAVAVIALRIQAMTGITPDVYFEWSSGSPLREAARYLFTGRGQNATATQEILRRAEADEDRRPRIHVD